MNTIKNLFKSLNTFMVLWISSMLFAPAVLAENTVMVNGVLVNSPLNGNQGGLDGTFNTLFGIARTIVSGITGILAIVMVFIFTWKAFQFARTGDNPSERVKAINGMIFFFIGAACFGAASLITGVFSGMLQGI